MSYSESDNQPISLLHLQCYVWQVGHCLDPSEIIDNLVFRIVVMAAKLSCRLYLSWSGFHVHVSKTPNGVDFYGRTKRNPECNNESDGFLCGMFIVMELI